MPDLQTLPAGEGSVDVAIAERTRYGVTAKVRLGKSGFTPTPASVQADYIAHEADFTGYAAITVAAWDAVFLSSDGNATFTNATSIFFQATDALAPNNIGFAWLEVGTKVQYYVIFDPPLSMAAALAAINMEWAVKFPGPGVVSFDS